jgi:hypothetical protein
MSRRKTRHLSFYQCKEKPVFLLRFAHLFVPLHENRIMIDNLQTN